MSMYMLHKLVTFVQKVNLISPFVLPKITTTTMGKHQSAIALTQLAEASAALKREMGIPCVGPCCSKGF